MPSSRDASPPAPTPTLEYTHTAFTPAAHSARSCGPRSRRSRPSRRRRGLQPPRGAQHTFFAMVYLPLNPNNDMQVRWSRYLSRFRYLGNVSEIRLPS